MNVFSSEYAQLVAPVRPGAFTARGVPGYVESVEFDGGYAIWNTPRWPSAWTVVAFPETPAGRLYPVVTQLDRVYRVDGTPAVAKDFTIVHPIEEGP